MATPVMVEYPSEARSTLLARSYGREADILCGTLLDRYPFGDPLWDPFRGTVHRLPFTIHRSPFTNHCSCDRRRASAPGFLSVLSPQSSLFLTAVFTYHRFMALY